MCTSIIADIRHCGQLHGNTFLVATELAHRMNSQGYGSLSYQFLAWKAHCSKRTAQRQVACLIDEYRLFRKTVIRTKNGNAWNLYQYIGPRLSRAAPPVKTQGDTVPSTLSDHKAQEAKELSLEEEIRQARKGLRFLHNPDSQWYRDVEANIARLEALRRCEHGR